MTLHDTINQKIVPPLFLIVFTSSVQIIALYGKREPITWPSVLSGLTSNSIAWKTISAIFAWAIIWLALPSKVSAGCKTDEGYLPMYKDNGVIYYLSTSVVFLICQWQWPNLSTAIYTNTPQILGALNIIALAICVLLFFKSKEGDNLPKLYIFYRGRELHPTIFDLQIKQLVIFRVAIMLWQIQVMAYYFAAVDRRSFDLPTLVTFLIQVAYIYKAFIYESAYYRFSLDIVLDRAGYYLFWGSLVWLPCLYPYCSYYLVDNKPIVSNTTSIILLIVGCLAIIGTALVDFQKAHFRNTGGKTIIWNKPPRFIRAEYTDMKGVKQTSLLLASGYWGLARHLNYTLEMLVVLCWTLPGYGLDIDMYMLIVFVVVLLCHRVYRDEIKCKAKYGAFWEQYCQLVPYRLIPYIL